MATPRAFLQKACYLRSFYPQTCPEKTRHPYFDTRLFQHYKGRKSSFNFMLNTQFFLMYTKKIEAISQHFNSQPFSFTFSLLYHFSHRLNSFFLLSIRGCQFIHERYCLYNIPNSFFGGNCWIIQSVISIIDHSKMP